MPYYVTNIQHSAKGGQRRNHKYSRREWTRGGWRYFYDTFKSGYRDQSKSPYTNVQKSNIRSAKRDYELYTDLASMDRDMIKKDPKNSKQWRKWAKGEQADAETAKNSLARYNSSGYKTGTKVADAVNNIKSIPSDIEYSAWKVSNKVRASVSKGASWVASLFGKRK